MDPGELIIFPLWQSHLSCTFYPWFLTRISKPMDNLLCCNYILPREMAVVTNIWIRSHDSTAALFMYNFGGSLLLPSTKYNGKWVREMDPRFHFDVTCFHSTCFVSDVTHPLCEVLVSFHRHWFYLHHSTSYGDTHPFVVRFFSD